MRVLVLGGTGFLGAALVQRLVAHGHLVCIFHRGLTCPSLPDSVEHILGNRYNLPNHSEQFRSFAPEIVVDAIAATREQTHTFMDVFRGIARRVVVLSSGDVYFANDILHRQVPGPLQPTPLAETAPLRSTRFPYRGAPIPASPWADPENYEKIDVEEVALSAPISYGTTAVKEWSVCGLPATILRLPMLYGPGAYDTARRRFFVYLKRIDDGREVILLNNAMAQWRAPWGYTENVAEAITLAIENDTAAGQIYNICEEGRPTIADWIRDLGTITNWPGRLLITSLPCPPPDMSSQLNLAQDLDLDSSKIRAELGYRELIGRMEALAQTVNWERQHPPPQIDPTQFDYEAEDALIAANHHR
jgi:nucleoside-diphosphate-sugar epimerase